MLSTTKLQEPCDKNCSHYRTPIQDPTGQSQELCVKDKLLYIQIDPTVNEVGTFILGKVCSVEKWIVPQNASNNIESKLSFPYSRHPCFSSFIHQANNKKTIEESKVGFPYLVSNLQSFLP